VFYFSKYPFYLPSCKRFLKNAHKNGNIHNNTDNNKSLPLTHFYHKNQLHLAYNLPIFVIFRKLDLR
tara:strand:- start:8553 stop:8753 length:201 start_codon:yes stop_codon:yes gene_type:complete